VLPLYQYKSIKYPANPINDTAHWLGSADEPLKGFSWRSGTKRDTTGITFWSDVFLYDNPNGQKLAVLVVDTQGLFDTETSTADNSKIFSLSSLMTSIQILNLQGLVQEDHLQYLQFATEFAKFTTSNDQASKPFQSFMFLIRDWNNPDEYPFGIVGGQSYLDNLLIVKPNQPADLQSVRNHVRASFEKLSCCLMPYPGKSVAQNSGYDGRWFSMDEEFLAELKIVIPKLLQPENLVTKKINNIEMNARETNEFFQQYIGLFSGSSSVQPQSIYETSVDKFMTAVVARSFEIYKNHVNNSLAAVVDENGIANVNNSTRAAGFAAYDAEKKMGSSQHVAKYRDVLDKKMESDGIEWRGIALANILRIRGERRRAEEAAREAKRIRLQRIEQKRLAQERIAQLEREILERKAEAARQREAIRQQKLAIQAEQERQRYA
jgi:atlastin